MKQTRIQKGFTLIEIMLVVAIIGILSAIAIPYFIRARIQADAKSCINNLKQLESAKQQYALEYKLKGSDSIPSFATLTVYLRNPDATTCPTNGGAYTDSPVVSENLHCPNFDIASDEFSMHKFP